MKYNNYKFEILGSPVDKNTHFLKILNDNPNKKVLSLETQNMIIEFQNKMM